MDTTDYVGNAASAATQNSRRMQARERDVFDTDEEAAAVSNPVAASAGVKKKAGMVLGEETTGDKVRGADGKVRRKVKKLKKSGDEV